MNPMYREKQKLYPRKFVTLSKRRGQIASLINQRKMMKPKPLLFAEKMLKKRSYISGTFQNSLSLLPHMNNTKETTKNWVNKGPFRLDYFRKRIPTQKKEKEYFVENQFANYPKPYFETGKKEDNLEKTAKQSSYFYLDSSLKNFLASILNIRIPSVKIYRNQASDMLAKRFDADAVTYKDNIFFRTGKYDPQDKKGVALLGHELTHAAKIKAQSQNLTELTMTDYAREEQEAINNERKVLNYFSSIGSYRGNRELLNQNPIGNSLRVHGSNSKVYRSRENPVNSEIFSNSINGNNLHNRQAQTPRTAPTSRDLNSLSEINKISNSAFQLSEEQFRLTTDNIYRDILNRIRTEFERGG
jgi:hypothetical protein